MYNDKPIILIAEDNELNLTLVKEMILKDIPNALIHIAQDGISAIQAVRELNPDIVLMDVQMPHLDGLNATRQIRTFSSVPIIALTAGALNAEKEECYETGMNDFLTKPVVAKELLDALSKHLGIVVSNLNPDIPTEEIIQVDLHINQKSLLNNLSQDKKTMFHLFQIAKNSFPKTITSLKQAFADENQADIKSSLHSIRGSAQNMYFVKLADLTRFLENNFQNLEPLETEKYLFHIAEEWDTLVEIIDHLILVESNQSE